MPSSLESIIENIRELAREIDRSVRLMEVCGTHTHAIGKAGLRSLIPGNVHLISGPGCPVCVTSQRDIERMILLARQPDIIICTFGDMLRVPGVTSSLEQERSRGADIRVVYSVLDALRIARENPGRPVTFLSVGFETTAPGIASAILQAHASKQENFTIYASHKLVVPAMEAVLQDGAKLDGFLTPGHVSVIIGPEAYDNLCRVYGISCVATGFAPMDILSGIYMLLECIVHRRTGSYVQYKRAVRPGGNKKAWEILLSVFEIGDADWRGLGNIPKSGLVLRSAFLSFDAANRFELPELEPVELPGCRCGDVLRGLILPTECPAFRTRCTPRNPLGPCMVSSEGACAAYWSYGRLRRYHRAGETAA